MLCGEVWMEQDHTLSDGDKEVGGDELQMNVDRC